MISAKEKKSRNGKAYLVMETTGPSGVNHRMNAWAWNGKTKLEPYSIIVAPVSKDDDFGMATMAFKMRVLDVD